jgi:DNA-binding sugar fermentation-stimulating protein
MLGQGVIYMDKKAYTTAKFTQRLEDFLAKISEDGIEVVAAVPNTGINETLGIWLFVRRVVDPAGS